MAVEKIVSEDIVDGKRYKKMLSTTHIRFEGGKFTQYKVNPKAERYMFEVPADTLWFTAYQKRVNGHVFSNVIEANGRSGKTTYHCQA